METAQARSGNAAIGELSWAEVNRIREQFEALNPWRNTPKTLFLKLEDESFDSNGQHHEPYVYSISAKLYCLFNLDGNRLLVRKPSGYSGCDPPSPAERFRGSSRAMTGFSEPRVPTSL